MKECLDGLQTNHGWNCAEQRRTAVKLRGCRNWYSQTAVCLQLTVVTYSLTTVWLQFTYSELQLDCIAELHMD